MRIAAALALLFLAATAEAKEKAKEKATAPGGTADALGAIDQRPPGEDDELYRCGKAKGPIAVTFKPGTELADLVAWAMSFRMRAGNLGCRRVVPTA